MAGETGESRGKKDLFCSPLEDDRPTGGRSAR